MRAGDVGARGQHGKVSDSVVLLSANQDVLWLANQDLLLSSAAHQVVMLLENQVLLLASQVLLLASHVLLLLAI